MRSRRGAVRLLVALCATASMHVALGVLGGGCGTFGVSGEDADAAGGSAEATTGDDGSSAAEASRADADADADGDAGTRTPPDATCGAHDFCADFEQPTAKVGWDVDYTLGGGALSIAPGLGWPGNALRSTIPAQSIPAESGANQYAYLTKSFPNAPGIHVEVEIDVDATPLDTTTVLTLFQFSGGAAAGESGVGIQLSSPSVIHLFVAGGQGSSMVLATPLLLPRATWVHMVLDMRFGTNQPLSLSLGGATANQTITTVAPTTVPPQIRVGVQHYTGTTSATGALYDTVRADILR